MTDRTITLTPTRVYVASKSELGPMSQDTETQADNAARWWADVIALPQHDNGDVMFSVMLNMATNTQSGPTREQRDTFRRVLAGQIQAELDSGRKWLPIGVDYGPDPILADAAAAAGIANPRRMGTFPVKTMMHVAPGQYTRAAVGYQAPLSVIWGELPATQEAAGL